MSIERNYTNIAILLHWITFVLITILFALGWYMTDLPKGSEERSYFFALHKSIGLTLACLIIVRVVWRIMHKPPDMPQTLAQWQQRLANLVHTLLYVFMVLQPLSGYISSSFSGYKTRIWGLPLPHWGWKNKALNEFFTGIHEISSMILLLLILIHLAGAFAFLFSSHENVLRRMLPFKDRD